MALITQLKEDRANVRLCYDKRSLITKYIVSKDHGYDWNDTIILDIMHRYRLISEMVLITLNNSSENIQSSYTILFYLSESFDGV